MHLRSSGGASGSRKQREGSADQQCVGKHGGQDQENAAHPKQRGLVENLHCAIARRAERRLADLRGRDADGEYIRV